MSEDLLTVVLVGVLILVVWWRGRPEDRVWRDL